VPNNLAGLYRAIGRYAAAEPFFRRTVASLEKSLPADHPTLTRVRENHVVLLGCAAEAAPRRPCHAYPSHQPRLAITAVALVGFRGGRAEGADGQGERLRRGLSASIGAAHASPGEPAVVDR
jgi:hypothetical protein